MDVRMPDGVIVRNVPDGIGKDELLSRYERKKRMAALPQSMANIEADQAAANPVTGMGTGERLLAGAGKAAVDLGRGAGQLAGVVSNADVTESRALDAPLMATTAGKVGNLAGNVAAAAPAAFVPGANTVVGAGVVGAGLGLLQPAGNAKERAINTAVGGAAGAGGQKLGQVIGQKVGAAASSRAAQAAETKAANAVRDETIRQARQAGYVLPPATLNQGSRAAVAAESLSGKAATQQTAAYRNQAVTNRMIRSDLGLKGARQTTEAELAAVRKQGGKVYDTVAKSGRIVPDQQFLDDVAGLSNVLDDVGTEFPGASAPSGDKIKELADSLFQQDFDAGAAVKYTRTLREQAKAGFKAVNAAGGNAEALAMARAQREAAGILEDMTMRHLRATGRGGLADSFDKARVLIAKSHDAEAALNPGTGNIDATKLGAMLRRGKPLGGNFETVAKFASAFPESARELKSGPGVSALSAVLSTAAGTAGAVSGNPAVLAAAGVPLARSGARAAILSGAGQAAAMPSYAPRTTLLDMMRRMAPLSAPVSIGVANSKE
jgi:hypothetical protein